MLTRRAYINLLYNNTSITRDIHDSLLGFAYEDYASGYSDNVSVSLHNISKKWLNEWAPEQGANIIANINTLNWHQDNDNKQLSCGSFYIDQIDYAGRPLTCNIGALALELNTSFRELKRNKAWQKITIRELATVISNQNNLELVFDSSNNIKLQSVKQSDMSDLEFLTQTCMKYGYAIKLYNRKIVIYREEEYELKNNYKIIREEDVIDWSGSKSLSNTAYDGCSIDYTNQLSGKKLSYSFNPQQGSKILKISDVVYSLVEAEYMTKAALRNVNKSQTIMSINMMGDTTIVSTSLIKMVGFGTLDGKYFVDKVTHNLPDYKIAIEAHRVLEGY